MRDCGDTSQQQTCTPHSCVPSPASKCRVKDDVKGLLLELLGWVRRCRVVHVINKVVNGRLVPH